MPRPRKSVTAASPTSPSTTSGPQGLTNRDLDPASTAGARRAAVQGGVSILMSTGSADQLESALDLCLAYPRSGTQLRTGGR